MLGISILESGMRRVLLPGRYAIGQFSRIWSVLFLGVVFLAGVGAVFGQTNPLAVSGRMIRGTGSNPNFQSFVIPLDFQKGVPLDPMGDNAAKFSGLVPWFSRIVKDTRYHFGQDVGDWGISFENTIAAFGSSAGGTPLYSDQSYSFGFYVGSRIEDANYPQFRYALRISVYRKSDL